VVGRRECSHSEGGNAIDGGLGMFGKKKRINQAESAYKRGECWFGSLTCQLLGQIWWSFFCCSGSCWYACLSGALEPLGPNRFNNSPSGRFSNKDHSVSLAMFMQKNHYYKRKVP
jgi:hypothetical protein